MSIHYLIFRSEDGNYPVLKDPGLKKFIKSKMQNTEMLILGIHGDNTGELEKIVSYASLKYDCVPMNSLTPNRAPVSGVDYIPEKKQTRLKLKIT